MTWQIVLLVSLGIGAIIAGGITGFTSGSLMVRILVGSIIGLIAAGLIFLSLKPWGFVDNYELGYVYNSGTGKINVPDHTGYVPRTPFFETVHTIDLRPRQVCINVGGDTAGLVNQRVLNCKLVSFNRKGLELFVSWHGRGDYSGSTLNDLLKIYAYDPSGRVYPFLNVSDETRAVQGPAIGTPVTAPGAPATPVTQ